MPFKSKTLSKEQAKDTPPYIREVIANHLSQMVDPILSMIPKVKKVVFYLGVSDVEAKDGTVISDGVGTTAGPMKATSSQERDGLISCFPDMPTKMATALRAQLDQEGDSILIIVVVAGAGIGHRAILELTKEELIALKEQ